MGARWEIALSPLKPVAVISNASEGEEAATAPFFIAAGREAGKVMLQILKYEHSSVRMKGDGHLLHETTSDFNPAALGPRLEAAVFAA